MNWLILQLAALLMAAVNSVSDKWLDRQKLNHPRLFLVSFALVNLPLVVIGISTQPFNPTAALLGLVSGLCFNGALLLYYRAVALEPAIRLTLPGRLMALISLPLNAFVLHERLSVMQIIAFVLMFAAGWRLTITSGSAGNKRLTRGFWLMLGVEGLYMLQDLLKNVLATQYDAWTMLTWERAGIVLGACLVLVRQRDRAELGLIFKTIPGRLRLLMLGKPAVHLGMGLLSGLAIQLAGAATKVMITGGVYPLLVVALAWLALGEQLNSKQRQATLVGALGAITGLSLLIF
jgi:drug/metabolite transporter (DMT)-like permease